MPSHTAHHQPTCFFSETITRRLTRASVLFSLLFISACSQQPTINPPQQQAQQAIPDHWNITAKLGIRTQDDSGSLTLQWAQKGQHYTIQASGPLGQGRATIIGQQQQIMISRPNQATTYSNYPEQLLEDTLGWQFPIQQLGYWVRGLPYPENNALTLQTSASNTAEYQWSPTGTLTSLRQSGWLLEYDRYQQTDAWLLPKRVKAKKDNITLTLIIKQWQLNPEQ